jgi:hypothetical protein
MKKYLIDKKTFDIYGSSDIIDDEPDVKYHLIEAETYKEAKTIRDLYESSFFGKKSIDIDDLISIINNMKTSHGSNDINPTNLKFIIKEFLK